jgi:hypothetical protein
MKKVKEHDPPMSQRRGELPEEKHAETLPIGAVITITVAAAIILVICLLFMFRGCATEPEPTTAPVIYQEPIKQPIISALTIIQKPVHEYHPSPNIPCKIGVDCGCFQVKDGVKGRCE